MSFTRELDEEIVEFYNSVLPDCDTEEQEAEALREFVQDVANRAYKLGKDSNKK